MIPATSGWSSSGAYALYGAIGAAIIAGVFTMGANRNVKAIAAADRLHDSAETRAARQHEIGLDLLRSTRAARLTAYPALIQYVNERTMTFNHEVDMALRGELPTANFATLSQGRQGEAWATMGAVGSEESVEAWHRFVRAMAVLTEALSDYRAVSAEGTTHLDEVPVDEVLAGLRLRLESRAMELTVIMRRDLTTLDTEVIEATREREPDGDL